jgi:hypothetical protein
MTKNYLPNEARKAAREAKVAEAKTANECYPEWAFGAFWLAINAELAKQGYPETGFKGAREAWESSINFCKLHPAYAAPKQEE